MKIEQKGTKEIIFTQPHLIDNILNNLGFKHAKDGKEPPAASSRILTRNNDRVDHNKSLHYRLVIGKLNYLEKGTRADISLATHQCARFAAATKKSHACTVRWLGRYLLHCGSELISLVDWKFMSMLHSPGIEIRNTLRQVTVMRQDLDMDTSSSTTDVP